MTDLDHLLDRARRGVLLPEEADWLAERVGELADAQQRYARALDRAHVLADELDGPGSIARAGAAGLLRDVLDVRPGVWRQRPVLAAVAPSEPLDGPVAASGGESGAGDAGAATGRQAGAEAVELTAATLHPVPDGPSTVASGPQSAPDGPDGAPEGRGPDGAAGGRTAAHRIRSGQVYVACGPLDEGRRIRVIWIGSSSRDGQIRIADADTGRRPRWIKAGALHASAINPRTGQPRRSGYALEAR